MDEARPVEPPRPSARPVSARALRRGAPPGHFRRSLALSLLLHAAVVAGVAAGGLERAGRSQVRAAEIHVARADGVRALEDPLEPEWEPEAEPDDALPEVVAAELREPVAPRAIDALDEELEVVELERGLERLPLEPWARPQPPPAARDVVEAPPAPEFVPRRLGEMSETVVLGVQGDTEPVLIEGREPRYPPIALRRGWEGTLVARIRVGADGLVEAVWVEESSGHDVLDAAALEAIRRWRFEPGRRAGKTRALEILHRVRFRLVDGRGRAGEGE